MSTPTVRSPNIYTQFLSQREAKSLKEKDGAQVKVPQQCPAGAVCACACAIKVDIASFHFYFDESAVMKKARRATQINTTPPTPTPFLHPPQFPHAHQGMTVF